MFPPYFSALSPNLGHILSILLFLTPYHSPPGHIFTEHLLRARLHLSRWDMALSKRTRFRLPKADILMTEGRRHNHIQVIGALRERHRVMMYHHHKIKESSLEVSGEALV